nr:MAG TPA: hypothetical protein [Caudoviricetes sp.]
MLHCIFNLFDVGAACCCHNRISFNCYSNYIFIITLQISNFNLNKTNF